MGQSVRYLVGHYDLEIPIYPLMLVEDVEILQSYTTTVEIPAPGHITFSSRQPGSGTLYQLNEKGDQRWVLNLKEHVSRQAYHLQPGSYRVIFRRGDLSATDFTVVKDFRVDSGDTENIGL